MNKPIDIKAGLEGYYRIVKRDAETMEVTQDTGWFSNLILDNGLNKFTMDNVATVCAVGTGSTPPVASQTGLQALVGSTTSVQEGVQGTKTPSPYYGWARRRYRFAQGVATGNLSEVGIGIATNNLFSRALIVDGSGNPITITVLPTEVLDVWYELRVYLNEADVNFQIQIGAVLHDCVLRPSDIASQWLTDNFQDGVFTGFDMNYIRGIVGDGPLGSITQGVPGSLYFANSSLCTILPYINNSYYRDTRSVWGLNEGNVPGGVDWGLFRSNIGDFKVSFVPPIAKDGTKALTLTFRFSWARHTP